ncbi:MAG: TRAP transporter TatT component family protein [Bryobacteraceae bacterium]|jgi:predicted anti-sigma-YlaC factor YlaD
MPKPNMGMLTALIVPLLAAGCSIRRFAVNQVGNALASGGSTFTSDDDPDLVADAIPFGLKMYESLLAESPKHAGLLLAAAQGFTEYSYAFVDSRIDEAREENLDRANALRDRARKLYLRAYRYGMRGLEARHPGFATALNNDADRALQRAGKRDVALLYWTAASRGLAISLSKNSPEMIAELPLVQRIVARVAQLDEGFEDGAVPDFLIAFEASRTDIQAEERQKLMRRHLERAIELSKGRRAGTYVSFAENACLPAQNAEEFTSMLEKALAVDADADPDRRLANLVAQRRARWLLHHIDELFLPAAKES